MAQYVGMVLGTMCTRLGSHDFESAELKMEQKRLAIGQMFVGDVFYAYVWLRIQALGAELVLNLTCPQCNKKIENFVADLDSVEVEVADTLDDACWDYELKNPLTIRGETVSHLVLGPARWNAIELVKGGGRGVAKPLIIKAAIQSLGTKEDNKRIALTETELDELTKRDIEAMVSQIDNRSIGPSMAIEGTCKACARDFRLPIDWGYDSFFGDSSQ